MPPSDHLFSVFLWNESEEFIGARWGTTFVGAELYSKSAQVSITNMETNNTEESLHEERRARCSSTVLESNHGLYFFLKHEPHDLESFFYYHCCIRGCSSEETNPPNSSPRPSKTSTKTVKRKNELKRSQEKRSHFSKYGNGGRVWFGWRNDCKNRNLNPPRTPIRVTIYTKIKTHGYPKPDE